MIRTFLGVGDRAGEAVITEGLPSVTCSNPPPCVNISTLYMKTWCNACKQEGFIAPRGPRWPGTGPNGKEWALSGDVNICGCNPSPVFYAERNMTMSFTSEQAAALMGQVAKTTTEIEQYDEQFTLCDGAGKTLPNTYYTVHLASGELRHGVTDSRGRTARYKTDGAQNIRLYLGHRDAAQ